MWQTEKAWKRINVKAENGIRRLRDNVPTRPLSVTTASGFHSMARTCKTWLPPAPGSRGRGLLDSDWEIPIVLGCPSMYFSFNPHGNPGLGICPESGRKSQGLTWFLYPDVCHLLLSA